MDKWGEGRKPLKLKLQGVESKESLKGTYTGGDP